MVLATPVEFSRDYCAASHCSPARNQTIYFYGMMVSDEALKSPALNDKQKKLLTQVLGQLKEVVAKAPAQANQ